MKQVMMILLCAIGLQTAQAQQKFKVDFPYTKAGRPLRNAWCGGLNSPQFSTMYINDDTLIDLLVFDRRDDKVLVFINSGSGDDTAFVHESAYEKLFPEMTGYCLARDYNHDGEYDLFTYNNPPSGIRVFKTSRSNGLPHFDLVKPYLNFSFGANTPQIYTSAIELPAIDDINGDGDIDVVCYPVFGFAFEYYENQTVEGGYAVDSFKYYQETTCWGGFGDNFLGNSVNFGACKTDEGTGMTNIEEENNRDGYKSACTFDIDSDGDKDFFMGTSLYSTSVFIENCGDSSYANMCSQDSIFPACNSTFQIYSWPTPYVVNLYNTAQQQLLFTTNAQQATKDVNNVALYGPSGNTSCPYELRSDTFLTESFMDFGTSSKGVFFDYNSDGKLDIVVGNYGYYAIPNSVSKLALLENDGTITEPSFFERSLNWTSLQQYNWTGISPAFGDLDGDQLPDMLIGNSDGLLQLFKNTGGAVAAFPALTNPDYFNMDVGQFATPFIKDINGDSLPDIVSGNKNGKLFYYWNMGTTTSPLFHRDSVNNFFGEINVTKPGYPEGKSFPWIATDSSGNEVLYVGSEQGLIFRYFIDTTRLRAGAFTAIDTNFVGYDMGRDVTISVADVNNDSKLDYLLGCARGGLVMFSDTMIDTGIVIAMHEKPMPENELSLYPNPATNHLVVTMKNGDGFAMQIYNLLGEKVLAEASSTAKKQLNISTLSSGIYHLRVNQNLQYFTRTFIKQ